MNKFDADLVSKVARAAAAGGGTHIDIACDPDLVRAAKAVSNVPVSFEGGFPVRRYPHVVPIVASDSVISLCHDCDGAFVRVYGM